MLILCVSLLSLAAISVNRPGDDRILQGKLIDADADDKIVTFVTDKGKLIYIAFDSSSLVYNSDTISQSGFRDSSLKRGTPIKIVLHKSRYLIKELHYFVGFLQ